MKNCIKKSTPTVLLLLLPLFTCGQMIYIGLKDEANVRIAQVTLTDLRVAGRYWPKTQLIDNHLYVPTLNGIYRKDLTALNNTNWELYAFEGIPVRDFIKNNDTVIAATAIFSDRNLLMLSTDDGLTCTDFTPDYFMELDISDKCTILRLAQNPDNRNTVMALHEGNTGVSVTADFGAGWSLSSAFIGGFQDRFIGFNPNDTANIFYTGETEIEESYIMATHNSGATWTKVEAIQSHCTHGIAFHPSDKNRMVSYGEGRIAKSTDQGITWTWPGTPVPEYIYKVIYDPANPEILYASGAKNGPNEGVRIHRSTDGGDSWHVFYEEVIENSNGIMDIHLYDNKLIIYTLVNGVYYLDLGVSGNDRIACEKLSTVYPNPASDVINIFINGTEEAAITLLNMNGSVVFQQKTRQPVMSIPVQSFAKGTYFVHIQAGENMETHKIIIK